MNGTGGERIEVSDNAGDKSSGLSEVASDGDGFLLGPSVWFCLSGLGLLVGFG